MTGYNFLYNSACDPTSYYSSMPGTYNIIATDPAAGDIFTK